MTILPVLRFLNSPSTVLRLVYSCVLVTGAVASPSLSCRLTAPERSAAPDRDLALRCFVDDAQAILAGTTVLDGPLAGQPFGSYTSVEDAAAWTAVPGGQAFDADIARRGSGIGPPVQVSVAVRGILQRLRSELLNVSAQPSDFGPRLEQRRRIATGGVPTYYRISGGSDRGGNGLMRPNAVGGDAISFDDLKDGDSVAGLVPNCQFTNAVVLTAGVSLNELEAPPHSGGNVAGDVNGPMTIAFSTLVFAFDAYFTYSTPLTIRAFDAAGNQISSATSKFANNFAISGNAGSTPNELVHLASATAIARITVTGAPTGGSFVMDDVQLTSASPLSAPLRFVSAAPCRIADTRRPAGPFGGPALAGGAARAFDIPASPCGIPPTALAYSLNLAVVPAGPLGYVTVWPSGRPQPLVSTLNSLDGRIKANAAIVPAGTGGAISVFATNPTDVVLDINGYFVSAVGTQDLAFYSIAPCRLVDTRTAIGAFGGPIMAGGSIRTFPVLSGSCNLPPAAQAYVMNMAVAPSGPLGFLSTWPAGLPQPVVATLNSLTGTVVANMAIVPAGSGGAISVFASNPTNLIIDITGYFAPPGTGSMDFFAVSPCRIADTRNAAGTFGGPTLSGGTARTFPIPQSACVIPSAAKAFALNASVVPSGPLGFLTLWGDGPRPVASTLNSLDGSIASSAAITPTGADGVVTAWPSNPTHFVLDINGYFQ